MVKIFSPAAILLLVLGLLTGGQAEATATPEDSVKILSYEEIYQLAYQTALEDGNLNLSEKALLSTLRTSLGLSKTSVAEIENKFMLSQTPTLDQSGRWPLVAQNMIYGTSLYGWMIPYVLDVQDYKWYVGSEMMSLGAAYYLTYKYTENMEISHARAQMMRAGSAVGLRYGQGLNALFGVKSWGFSCLGLDAHGFRPRRYLDRRSILPSLAPLQRPGLVPHPVEHHGRFNHAPPVLFR